MAALPPDLSRLGDALTAATAYALEKRRRRRRLLVHASASVSAALACFAILVPAEPAPEPQQWAMRLVTMPLAARSLDAVVPSPPARRPLEPAVARRQRSGRVHPVPATPQRLLRLWD